MTVPLLSRSRNRHLPHSSHIRPGPARRTVRACVRFVGVAALLALAPSSAAFARPASARASDLQKRVGAEKVAVEDPCTDPGPDGACRRHALSRVLGKLAEAKQGHKTVRILHLGDSHVVSDYITRTIRARFHEAYGDAGRGFVIIDQARESGGRLLGAYDDWTRERIVDAGQAGKAFGFSGTSLESTRKGAKLTYALLDGEPKVRLFYHAQPGGGAAELLVDGKPVRTLSTEAAAPKSATQTFDIPAAKGRSSGKKRAERKLEIVAQGPHARLFGIAFETGRPGAVYEAIGPLGAYADVYLQLDRDSFQAQLIDDAPDLVVLMVGGNDALRISQGKTAIDQVRKEHEALVDFIRTTLPDADCLLFAPMDAGEKRNGKVVSRAGIQEVHDAQKAVAAAKGCGFYDTLQAMGGRGAIARWAKAKVMNSDLVHPRDKAAQLLGDLFADAWLDLTP